MALQMLSIGIDSIRAASARSVADCGEGIRPRQLPRKTSAPPTTSPKRSTSVFDIVPSLLFAIGIDLDRRTLRLWQQIVKLLDIWVAEANTSMRAGPRHRRKDRSPVNSCGRVLTRGGVDRQEPGTVATQPTHRRIRVRESGVPVVLVNFVLLPPPGLEITGPPRGRFAPRMRRSSHPGISVVVSKRERSLFQTNLDPVQPERVDVAQRIATDIGIRITATH